MCSYTISYDETKGNDIILIIRLNISVNIVSNLIKPEF